MKKHHHPDVEGEVRLLMMMIKKLANLLFLVLEKNCFVSMCLFSIHNFIAQRMYHSVASPLTMKRASPSNFWTDSFHSRVCVPIKFYHTVASS